MTVPLRSCAGPSLSVSTPSSPTPSPYTPDSFSPGLSARTLRFRELPLPGDATDPSELDRRGGGFLLCSGAPPASSGVVGCLLLLLRFALPVPGPTSAEPTPLLLPARAEWLLSSSLVALALPVCVRGSRSLLPRLDALPCRRIRLRLRPALSLLRLFPVLEAADATEEAAVDVPADGRFKAGASAFPDEFAPADVAAFRLLVADPTLPDDDADAAEEKGFLWAEAGRPRRREDALDAASASALASSWWWWGWPPLLVGRSLDAPGVRG
jgi:hypothetical protein